MDGLIIKVYGLELAAVWVWMLTATLAALRFGPDKRSANMVFTWAMTVNGIMLVVWTFRWLTALVTIIPR